MQYTCKTVESIIGTYEVKIDAKGRLMLPASLKKQLATTDEARFVLKRSVFQKCLELYPMEEWKKVESKISKLNEFSKKTNNFIRMFNAGVKQIDMDAQGRLLVSKDLMTYANLSKELVLSSAVNKIEIWDKQLYEDSLIMDDEDFASLAEEVMGANIDLDL